LLATGWLIWRSGRRIVARLRGDGRVAWHAVPYLRRLACPLLFLSAIVSAGTEFARAAFSLAFFLLASVAVLLALLRRNADAKSVNRAA
jgi:hypothetical protein